MEETGNTEGDVSVEISPTSSPSKEPIHSNSEISKSTDESLEGDPESTVIAADSETSAGHIVPQGSTLDEPSHIATQNFNQLSQKSENISAETSNLNYSPASLSSYASVIEGDPESTVIAADSETSAGHIVPQGSTLDEPSHSATQNSNQLNQKSENISAETSNLNYSPASLCLYASVIEGDPESTVIAADSETSAGHIVPPGSTLDEPSHIVTQNSNQLNQKSENISAETSNLNYSPASLSSYASVIEGDPESTVIAADSETSAGHIVPPGSTLDEPSHIATQNSNRLNQKSENISAGTSNLNYSPASLSSYASAEQMSGCGFVLTFSNGSTDRRKAEDKLQVVSSDETEQFHVEVAGVQKKMVGSKDPCKLEKQGDIRRALVDTRAPFESVKAAVSKFGGIVDWKAHKFQTSERRKFVEFELEKAQEEIPAYRKLSDNAESAKAQVLLELDSTKRCVEELKLNLEKAQTEENQAKQDSELARLRVEEIGQGIADEASVAAKAQLEVAHTRHKAAVAELNSLRDELEALKGQYICLVDGRNLAVKKAEETIAASKVVERTVEELTIELILAKESLESAHSAHLEAEEQRLAALMTTEKDEFDWERKLKEAGEEIEKLNEQVELKNELKCKLDSASQLLLSLKAELAGCVESNLTKTTGSMEKEEDLNGEIEETKKSRRSILEAIDSAKKELEEVAVSIEKAKEDVNYLRVAAVSLKSELEREKNELASVREREERASVALGSLEAELNQTKSELEFVKKNEKESREKIVEMPKALQQAAHEADRAKLEAQVAREEHRKAKEEEAQAKAVVSTTESRLLAALKEIDAAKASERFALAAVKAMQESELPANPDSTGGVTLSLVEYYELSKQAHVAEEQAGIRVAAAIAQIEVANGTNLTNLEKLDAASKEISERKETLRTEMEKAEMAQAGKLSVEQELREWRAEHEERRRASDAGSATVNPIRSPPRNSVERMKPKSFISGELETAEMQARRVPSQKICITENTNVAAVEPQVKVKKRAFFPRIIMFLARRKSHSK